ncbi:MAG: beta-hydroxylase [Pirellulaceae bacterium]|nr:beta-hydroxylase [Pirellulaceae bacterium]
MSPYLHQLTLRLAAGVLQLPEGLRQVHADYVKSLQQSDGGFPGREGGSDLYYTGFALRSLFLLGELSGPTADHAADFLRSRFQVSQNVLDLLSLIYGATLLEFSAGIDVLEAQSPSWRDAVAATLERLRRDDGGYAKTSAGGASSTYHSFLAALCLQLIGRPLPNPERLVEFLLSQRCEGGGFRDIRAAKRAGTNPTAAAIGVLKLLNTLDNEVLDDTIEFLSQMQTAEGGLRANTRIPVADLLSTFTGVVTLADLKGLDSIDAPAALRFARILECSGGGFRGAAWDADADVEYTFYGLGCLALLTPAGPPEAAQE